MREKKKELNERAIIDPLLEFVLDNTFSIHTSKRLTFFVALEERGPTPVAQPTSEMTGWLLKKKRKRMQGM